MARPFERGLLGGTFDQFHGIRAHLFSNAKNKFMELAQENSWKHVDYDRSFQQSMGIHSDFDPRLRHFLNRHVLNNYFNIEHFDFMRQFLFCFSVLNPMRVGLGAQMYVTFYFVPLL